MINETEFVECYDHLCLKKLEICLIARTLLSSTFLHKLKFDKKISLKRFLDLESIIAFKFSKERFLRYSSPKVIPDGLPLQLMIMNNCLENLLKDNIMRILARSTDI